MCRLFHHFLAGAGQSWWANERACGVPCFRAQGEPERFISPGGPRGARMIARDSGACLHTFTLGVTRQKGHPGGLRPHGNAVARLYFPANVAAWTNGRGPTHERSQQWEPTTKDRLTRQPNQAPERWRGEGSKTPDTLLRRRGGRSKSSQNRKAPQAGIRSSTTGPTKLGAPSGSNHLEVVSNVRRNKPQKDFPRILDALEFGVSVVACFAWCRRLEAPRGTVQTVEKRESFWIERNEGRCRCIRVWMHVLQLGFKFLECFVFCGFGPQGEPELPRCALEKECHDLKYRITPILAFICHPKVWCLRFFFQSNWKMWHFLCENMGASLNVGTPKSSILIGFSMINHPFWGTPIFGFPPKHSSLEFESLSDVEKFRDGAM